MRARFSDLLSPEAHPPEPPVRPIHVRVLGRYTSPAECDHPVSARVTSTHLVLDDGTVVRAPRRRVAECRDCGCYQTSDGRWHQ